MESKTKHNGVVTRNDGNDVDDWDAIIEESRKISSSTENTECISPCTVTKSAWKRVPLAVGSGACENVTDAEEMVPGFVIKQTKLSMSGIKYV